MVDQEITEVTTVSLRSELDEKFGYSQAWVTTREALLVKVATDDGTTGWGECWGPIAGSRETINEFYADVLVGEDPLNVERLHKKMVSTGRLSYQSIVPWPAISGIDIALWDLKGKLLDQSIASLLGGRERNEVRGYATGHYFKDVETLDEQYERIASEAEKNADRLGAVKAKIGLQHLGYGPEEDLELLSRIRSAVGDETTLMVDANYAYDVGTARMVGKELEELDVYWFEEPIHPENWREYSRLRNALNVRIAGGECNTPREFYEFFRSGGLDVAQPDIGNVGGLTSAKTVAQASNQHGVELIPHVWGTPIAIAASLHLIATLDGQPWVEYDLSSNPIRNSLSTFDFLSGEDGQIKIPEGAGLGIDVDIDAVNRFKI